MKLNLLKSSLLVASLIASSSVMAESSGFYGVLGFQQSVLDQDTTFISDLGVSVDDNDTGMNIGLGYKINNFISAEGGYMSMGDVFSASGSVSAGGVGDSGVTEGIAWSYTNDLALGASGAVDADGWTLGALLTFPATDKLSVYAKGGMYFWDAEGTLVAGITAGSITIDGETYNGTESISVSDSGTDPYFGVGVQYDINEQLGFRVDYTRYQADITISSIGGTAITPISYDADIDTYGASLVYKF